MPTTVHHSYWERVGNSFKGILTGFVLIIGAIILLCWNENNYLQQKESLEELAQVTEEAKGDSIDASLEGKAIHFQAVTNSTDSVLTDDTFGVTVNDLKLKREVSMYQWEEESREECTDNVGGSQDCTTYYSHHKVWSEDHLDSSSYQDEDDCPNNNCTNPSTWEYETKEREKSPITAGAYTLTDSFVRQLNNYVKINLNEQQLTITGQTTQNTETPTTEEKSDSSSNSVADNNNSYLYGDSTSTTTTTTTNTTSASKFHIFADYIYVGKNPNSPEIWDMKISFESVHTGTVSIIGKQSGTEVRDYKTSNGRSQALLTNGSASTEDMILDAQNANKMMTWFLRFVGLFIMYIGFSSLFKFIETIAKVIPFVANLIGVATGIAAFGLTLIVGFTTIAIAWLAVRPVIWICCLVVVAGGIYLLVKSKKTKNQIKDGEGMERKEA